MTILNRENIRELIEYGTPPCVSMFMPTHRGTREERQDAIRAKNLRTEALNQLGEQGLRRSDAEAILEPVRQLFAEEISCRRGEGLACFAAKDYFRAYCVPLLLDELLVVNERFYVKPLLPLLHSNGRFYVLSLTKDSARLFEATRESVRELDMPEIPRAELDGTDAEALQYHAYRAPSMGKGGTGEAMFHGQGGPDDRAKVDTVNYYHRVDDAVRQVLNGGRTPLILACVDYLAPLYRTANRYPGLLDEHVSGSPEQASLASLRERAWQIVEPQFKQGREEALRKWRALEPKQLASCDLRETVRAAGAGRIDTLLLKHDAARWGHVGSDGNSVSLLSEKQPDAVELVDYLAARTLTSGGEVFTVDDDPAPDSPVAATFRY